MKKLTISTLIGFATTCVLMLSAPSNAAMDPYVEQALQNVCHSRP